MSSITHSTAVNADLDRDHQILVDAGYRLGPGAYITDSGDCSRTKAGNLPRGIFLTDAEGTEVATRDVPREVVQAALRLAEGGALGKMTEWAVLYDNEAAQSLDRGREALVFPNPIGSPGAEMALVNTPEDAIAQARTERDGTSKCAYVIGARGRAWGDYDCERLSDRMTNDIGSVSLAEREGNGPWRLILD